MSRSKSFAFACPLASGRLATLCGRQLHAMPSQAFRDLSLGRVLCPADPAAPRNRWERFDRLRKHGGHRDCVAALHRKKSVDKVVTCVELCIGIRKACIGNAYSCAYAIQAATGQVVWPRAGQLHAMHLHLPCLPLHGAVRPRATWRHAPVHAHGHNQCSSSLRGLDSCISATGTDIT